MKPINLPIFPLKLVVLPGTIQGLQIFEPRYLNMVKQCMSNASNFVISYKSDKFDDFDFWGSEGGGELRRMRRRGGGGAVPQVAERDARDGVVREGDVRHAVGALLLAARRLHRRRRPQRDPGKQRLPFRQPATRR